MSKEPKVINRQPSGGVYCIQCKKCLSRPRVRKNWQPSSEILCDECHSDVLTVTFRPREESLLTHFKIKFEDIPKLVDLLQRAKSPC